MDVAELIPLAIAFAVALLGAAGFRLAGRSTAARGRLGVRVVAALVMAGALALGIALVVFDLRFERVLPPVVSPDGRHRAVTTYTINPGAGADEAEVVLRRSWNPFGTRVYVGPAKFRAEDSPQEPEVSWADDTHLVVRFHAYATDGSSPYPQGCATSAMDVAIQCEGTLVHAVR